MGWLSIIGQLVGLGPAIASITSKIVDARIAKENAVTEQERIHADERVKELEAVRDVQIEESKHSSLNIYARVGFAAPIIIVLWKILVWDQALRLGSTPDLGDKMWNLIYIVAGFYFVQSIAQLLKK